MAMNRAQFKKQLQEGLNAVFGLEYARKKDVWRKYLDYESESKKAFVEDVMMAGFAAAPVKGEGAGVSYDNASEIYTARYLFETVALAFAITEEAEEDNLYGSIGARLSRALARSMQHTSAVKSANIINNGFDTNYPGGDGLPLFSAAHLVSGGTASNLLATASDLSETSLEDMLIMIDQATDYKGIPIQLDAQLLGVPPALRFIAHRILHSELQNDSADNAINAVRDAGLLSGGYVVDTRLTDTDAWFIKTDCPDGMKHIQRVALKKGLEGDFETGNMRYKARERYIKGWSDWHGAYGTPGGG